MKNGDVFIGKWVSTLPFDSDDYLVEYVISIKNESFQIEAKDLQDNENMEISDISFDGEALSFISYMASTKRKGNNRFRLIDDSKIEAEFTFTVVEELKKT